MIGLNHSRKFVFYTGYIWHIIYSIMPKLAWFYLFMWLYQLLNCGGINRLLQSRCNYILKNTNIYLVCETMFVAPIYEVSWLLAHFGM